MEWNSFRELLLKSLVVIATILDVDPDKFFKNRELTKSFYLIQSFLINYLGMEETGFFSRELQRVSARINHSEFKNISAIVFSGGLVRLILARDININN